MIFRQPEQMQEVMAPAVGEPSIRPSIGRRFQASLDMFRMKHVCLFTVHANSLHAQIRPPHSYFAVNVPLGRPFHARIRGNYEGFSGDRAHLLHPLEELVLDCPENFSVLACCFSVDRVSDYARSILQSDDISDSALSHETPLFGPGNVNLQRSLAKAWSRLHSDGMVNARYAISEIDDQLMTQFVLFLDSRFVGPEKRRPVYLKTAEEYLCANVRENVTRDALSESVGIPLRTLSWAFQKYHGTGPMGFVKQRQLEAAYRDLSSSEPGDKKVTDIATDYHFSHLGKFAIEYKRNFGESPSETLARTKR